VGERQTHPRLWEFAVALVIPYWLDTDTRCTKLMRVYDREFSFFVAWPVVLPYYLIKTRGLRKGLTIMLEWIGVFFGVSVISALLR
jgi:hypothetical protein